MTDLPDDDISFSIKIDLRIKLFYKNHNCYTKNLNVIPFYFLYSYQLKIFPWQ